MGTPKLEIPCCLGLSSREHAGNCSIVAGSPRWRSQQPAFRLTLAQTPGILRRLSLPVSSCMLGVVVLPWGRRQGEGRAASFSRSSSSRPGERLGSGSGKMARQGSRGGAESKKMVMAAVGAGGEGGRAAPTKEGGRWEFAWRALKEGKCYVCNGHRE